jgi:chitin synthase
VEGEIRSKGHDDKTTVFDGTTIPLRRWEDWERSRLRKLRREEKRRRDMERQYGGGFHGDDGGLAPGRAVWARSEYESDAGSVFSSEEDVWGAEIGGVSYTIPPLLGV